MHHLRLGLHCLLRTLLLMGQLIISFDDEVVKNEDLLGLVTSIKTSHKVAIYDVYCAYGHHENICLKSLKI